MKNPMIFLLLIGLTVLSCKKEQNQNNQFSLEASLTNISDGTLFYIKSWDSNTKLDSARVTEGQIHLEGQLNLGHPEKLFLYAIDSISKEFIYTNLIVENESVNFKADKVDFPWNIDVHGSEHQDKAEMYNQIEQSRQEKIKALKLKYSPEEDELRFARVEEISDSLDLQIVKLINEDYNTYAALSFFTKHKTKFTNDQLKAFYNALDTNLKSTAIAESIKLQSEYPMPKVGDRYYDYSAIDQNGSTLSLSDIHDKYILLHFSSSACYPSQLSLAELKPLYEKHGDSLEVVSISEDVDKNDWLNTVEADSIPWPYLWDGKGAYSDAVVKYWEIGTPNYVLISPDKVILEKWFGYYEGIFDDKLKQYFN